MKKTILSVTQSELLERLIVKYGQIVTAQQIYGEVGNTIDQQYAKKLVTKLVADGWLIRIKRGLYVISDLSNRGFLALSPYKIANLLVNDSYVSFELALSYYGMFDQLTNKVISIAKNRYKTVRFDTIECVFVNVQKRFFFGWREVVIDGYTICVATAEKALIDMIQFHRSKYSVDLVIEKLEEYQRDLDMTKFCEYLGKMSSTTIRVFGFIFDLLQIDSSCLFRLIKDKRGTHWMFASDKKFNAKWRLYYDEYFDKYSLTK